MIKTIYFNRDSEDNWSIVEEAKKNGISNFDDLRYLGYEVEMKVEIQDDGKVLALEINGNDVSDIGIYI